MLGKPLLVLGDPHICAIAVDRPSVLPGLPVPVFERDDVAAIAALVAERAAPLP